MAEPSDIEDIWRRYKTSGGEDLRGRLILTYAPLVKYVTGRLGPGLPAEEEDLIAYGLLGLVGAIERYELDRGVTFETYATARIKGSIIDELRSLDWVPRSLRRRAGEIERAMVSLEHRLKRVPTDEELAAEIGISERDLQDSLTSISRSSIAALVELWTIFATGSDTVSLELKAALGEAIRRLPERERIVVSLYYYEELTLREVGEVLGETESRVSQLRGSAILRLKAGLQGGGWPPGSSR